MKKIHAGSEKISVHTHAHTRNRMLSFLAINQKNSKSETFEVEKKNSIGGHQQAKQIDKIHNSLWMNVLESGVIYTENELCGIFTVLLYFIHKWLAGKYSCIGWQWYGYWTRCLLKVEHFSVEHLPCTFGSISILSIFISVSLNWSF